MEESRESRILRKIQVYQRCMESVDVDSLDTERKISRIKRGLITKAREFIRDSLGEFNRYNINIWNKIIIFQNFLHEFEWSCLEKMTRMTIEDLIPNILFENMPELIDDFIQTEKDKFWEWANDRQVDLLKLRDLVIELYSVNIVILAFLKIKLN